MVGPDIINAYQSLSFQGKSVALDILFDKNLVCTNITHHYNIAGFKAQPVDVLGMFEFQTCARNARYRLLNTLSGARGEFRFYHVRIGEKLPYYKEYVRQVKYKNKFDCTKTFHTPCRKQNLIFVLLFQIGHAIDTELESEQDFHIQMNYENNLDNQETAGILGIKQRVDAAKKEKADRVRRKKQRTDAAKKKKVDRVHSQHSDELDNGHNSDSKELMKPSRRENKVVAQWSKYRLALRSKKTKSVLDLPQALIVDRPTKKKSFVTERRKSI